MRATAKYSLSSSRTSSGSRLSDSVVKLTRSPNSTVVVRRSETGPPAPGWAAEGAAGAGGAPPASGVPHSMQNLPPDTGCPQLGQDRANGVPHSRQNFAPSGLWWLQLVHCGMAGSLVAC